MKLFIHCTCGEVVETPCLKRKAPTLNFCVIFESLARNLDCVDALLSSIQLQIQKKKLFQCKRLHSVQQYKYSITLCCRWRCIEDLSRGLERWSRSTYWCKSSSLRFCHAHWPRSALDPPSCRFFCWWLTSLLLSEHHRPIKMIHGNKGYRNYKTCFFFIFYEPLFATVWHILFRSS